MKTTYTLLLVVLLAVTSFWIRNNPELLKGFCLLFASTSISLLLFDVKGEILKRDIYLSLQKAYEIGSTDYEYLYRRNLKKILSEIPEPLPYFFWENNPPTTLLSVLWRDNEDTEHWTKIILKKNDPQLGVFRSA